MGYPAPVMRRRAVVATAALIAAFALAGLPVPASSRTPSASRALEQAAFTSVTAPAIAALGASDAAPLSAGRLTADTSFVEPGNAPDAPSSRPQVIQPGTTAG